MNKSGQVWISAILYMLIATVAMTLIIQTGLPIIDKMKDRSTYSRTEEMLVQIDKQVAEVVSEGKGSQRIVPVEFRDGEILIDDGVLQWNFETDTKIFEPKTRIQTGNLLITTNSDVESNEYFDHYILKNSLIQINFTKYYNTTTWGSINTSLLINNIKILENNKYTNGTFFFMIADDADSQIGNGYTYLENEGTNLAYATVVAHVNSTNYEYDLSLTLESDADFLRINVKNLKVKN